eukprot:gnl/Chilomastix_caulleri/1010.p1 GENE.gnl/Chilomastix_caulleri/1010~~gnl/Chilomastix_caulleri/1010.p1  ORF type:complete len:175 (+),score=25.31 gnl/Chilomastix_caulleri/1010:42-566(+)
MSDQTHGLIYNIDRCAPASSFWSYLGILIAITLSSVGSAYGTAKAGVGVMVAGVNNPASAMKSTLPVIMAGILCIYGLIISIAINSTIGAAPLPKHQSMAHLGAGISTGVSSLAAGLAIGITGNIGSKAVANQPRVFVALLLILVFGEALALYGLIMSLVLALVGTVSCPPRPF